MTTAEQIRAIVDDVLCLSPGEASDYDSLSERFHMDSLHQAEIIIAIECELDIQLDLNYEFDTIGKLIEAVEAVV